MLQTIKGYYDNGIVVLEEQPKIKNNVSVFVTFIEDNYPSQNYKTGGIKIGGSEGLVSIPDDFNEPLDDLKEYM